MPICGRRSTVNLEPRHLLAAPRFAKVLTGAQAEALRYVSTQDAAAWLFIDEAQTRPSQRPGTSDEGTALGTYSP
jgi:hypothetical protein